MNRIKIRGYRIDRQTLIRIMTWMSLIMLTLVLSVQAEIVGDTLKSAIAIRTSGGINLDGYLNEPDWEKAPEITGFRQVEPFEGEPESQRTVVKTLYDDEAVYFGFWCHDTEPEKISAILTRRDRWAESDQVSVRIDSHHDHQNAYYFSVNAAGVLRDLYLFNNVYDDESWDAVWEADAKIHDWGWTAEFKIPYSALRFSPAEEYTWGFQLGRFLPRNQEQQRWQFVPQTQIQGISNYGHLTGIKGIEPPGRLETLPYLAATGIKEPKSQGNPDGLKSLSDLGVDFKYGLSSAFTVDATINPDFGQVESDESVLNLSTFETFYEEKRPFFLEGFELFRPLYFDQFYSRRIGGAPRGSIDSADYFIDSPRNVSILGASKLTGKTAGGTSIGFLNAVTADEKAEYAAVGSGNIYESTVEPLANYSVLRLKQDVFGQSYIGTMITAANQKDLTDAYSGSADWIIYLPNKNYYWQGQAVTTYNGPGTKGAAVMSGINKDGGKNIRGNVMFDYLDRKVDFNRLGFLNENGTFGFSGWLQARSNKKFSVFHFMNINFNGWYNEYLDGWRHDNGGNFNTNIKFSNNWWFYAGQGWNGSRYDLRETRGGMPWKKESGSSFWTGGQTDVAKSIYLEFGYDHGRNRGGKYDEYSLWVVTRPKSNLELSFGTDWGGNKDARFWVGTGVDGLPVFRPLDMNEFDISMRGIYTFTRNLSLQWYSQLYFSAGAYDEKYYRLVAPENMEEVDPDLYEINQRRGDFNYKSLNINLIMRWEFRPGSTFYVVWTQARDRYDTGVPENDYTFDFSRDFDKMFNLPLTNTFLAKVSYWWNI